ncbi:hypothetical protein, partial [Variovorax sp. KBW07]|uniref:hypothetical protein n=1 Tax=Variovorax sp. KBW07 TaxID=2153358 RepID=UPI001C8A5EBE
GFVGGLRGLQFFGTGLALQHLRILCGLLRVRHFSKNRRDAGKQTIASHLGLARGFSSEKMRPKGPQDGVLRPFSS